MKKFNKFLTALIIVTGFAFVPSVVNAYQIEQDPIKFSYNPGYASKEIIVLHESGNANNVGSDSLDNEVAYMKRNWTSAYVSFFVGSGGRVKQLAPAGYYQYGAGSWANARAYAQVELARTNNATIFKKDYAVYVNLIRDLAKQSNIPLTLDKSGRGLKTHLWITQNIWGNHTDPYAYLTGWGISKQKLAYDLQHGISETGIQTPVAPNAPQEEISKKPVATEIGSYTVKVNTNIRNSPSLSGNIAGMYSPGQSFNYDSKVTNEGYIWYSYISYSGVRRYVAAVNQTAIPVPSVAAGWTKETGTFYPDTTINVRSGASTSNSVVAQYDAGGAVAYDSYKVSGGYVWIHYTSYSGQDRYMAIRPQGGALWGYIR